MTTIDGNLLYDDENYVEWTFDNNLGDILNIQHYRNELWTANISHVGNEENFDVRGDSQIEIADQLIQRMTSIIKQLEEFKSNYRPAKIKDNIVDGWLIKPNQEEKGVEIEVPWATSQKGTQAVCSYVQDWLDSQKGYVGNGFTQP